MGNPTNYSVELPQRCLRLMRELRPYAKRVYGEGDKGLGPLSVTFLVTMSMPMLNIPLERIYQHLAKPEAPKLSDDRGRDQGVTTAVQAEISAQKELKDAAFFTGEEWRYVAHRLPVQNIANGLPTFIAATLNEPEALSRARSLDTETWSRVLRNAMAHGGIAYLDAKGTTNSAEAVQMLCFCSINHPYNPTEMRFLRISVDDYNRFLDNWVTWLVASRLASDLANAACSNRRSRRARLESSGG